MTRQEAIDLLDNLIGMVADNQDNDYDTAFKMAIEALRQPEQQWIPCSERLPYAEYGESDSVLCYTESGLQKILYFNGGCWCHPTGEVYEWNFPNGHTNRVVAWMPKPEPWKGEKNEQIH